MSGYMRKDRAKTILTDALTGSNSSAYLAAFIAGSGWGDDVTLAMSKLSVCTDACPKALFDALGRGVDNDPLTWGNLITAIGAQDAQAAYAYGEPVDFSAYVPYGRTAGDLITTKTTWVPFPTAGSCGIKLLLRNDCNTGEFASVRVRAGAYNTTASGNGGNSVGTTTGLDVSASARKAEYGNLKAVNAVAQPDAYAQTTDATNIVTALYGRIDATAASDGRRWVTWIDTHATTKAAASDYMVRISHNGTTANDGVFTIYTGGRLPTLFNFEDVAGFLSTATGATLTATHKIAVTIGGATRYILVGTV